MVMSQQKADADEGKQREGPRFARSGLTWHPLGGTRPTRIAISRIAKMLCCRASRS